MPLRFASLALLTCLVPAWAQDDPVATLPGTATERITADLRKLASEEFEGRGPETEGIKKAADLIRAQMQASGLSGAAADGGYFQPFDITLGSAPQAAETSLTLVGPEGGERELTIGQQVQPLAYGAGGSVRADLVFAGYGITAPKIGYDDFAGLDVKDKIAVILRREPRQDDPESPFDGDKTSRFAYISSKLKAAEDAGAAAVLLVNDSKTVAEEGDVLSEPGAFGGPAFQLPFGQITRQLADELLAANPIGTKSGLKFDSIAALEKGIDAALAPIGGPMWYSADLNFKFEPKQANVYNVVGVLEGEGPHADETVVLGAHYDHLGYGGVGSRTPGSNAVHNGADDNGSGTSLLLELIRRYGARAAAGEKPPRRMVFIAFSGEERGLLGSIHYVTKEPLFPLDSTRAMVNFDMVGKYGENAFQLHGMSSSPQFPPLVDVAAAKTGVVVDRVDGVLAASDHWDFIKVKIPAFHFFTGLHPDYHKPEDDVEKVNLKGIAELADFAEVLTDGILAGSEPLEFTEPPMSRLDGRKQAEGRPVLGVVPKDLPATGGGVEVDQLAPDGPAVEAGFRVGDVIKAVAGVPVADAVGLSAALSDAKVGQTIEVTVDRDGQTETLTVTLGAAE
ncbi:M28 family peptidase [Alienimonas californiensis]|uniref:Aminopeptidase YwaD n=1 Tax=Alienimonas californiensis TaxID=2527989 RepID=A0A517PAG5_9PLAN|nr:M28 family peptidase [Alienimonas californiensis]QDT16362.1 Aminopeptidase YwaD precursor [Alienimonas californiensis]